MSSTCLAGYGLWIGWQKQVWAEMFDEVFASLVAGGGEAGEDFPGAFAVLRLVAAGEFPGDYGRSQGTLDLGLERPVLGKKSPVLGFKFFDPLLARVSFHAILPSPRRHVMTLEVCAMKAKCANKERLYRNTHMAR